MARVGTSNLNLGTWTLNEHPGAGAQGSDSNLLNGNWYKLDVAVGVGHNADGSHKSNVIGANQISTGVRDGTSIIGGGGSALSINTGGVQKSHLNTNVADATTIEKDASVGLRIVALGVTGAKLKQTGAGAVVDESTLEFSSDKMRVKDGGLAGVKLAQGNNRTKILIPFYINAADEFARVSGVIMTSSMCLTFPRACSVTAVSTCDSAGATYTDTVSYGTWPVSVGQKVFVKHYNSGAHLLVVVNGTGSDLDLGVGFTFPVMGVLEVEFAS
jgi:hypothetical protein